MAATAGSLFGIWAIVLLLVAILETKPLLRQLLAEQKRTIDLLQTRTDRVKEIREGAWRSHQ